MTLSTALSSALSGLKAGGRAADVVSSNLANATTDGYAPRALELSPERLGGVSVQGVTRAVEEGLVSESRLSQARFSRAETLSSFAADMERAIGNPTEASSLSAHATRFEASLVEAASRPDVTVRLEAAVDEAQALAGKLGGITDAIQNARTRADAGIERAVETVNATLSRLEKLDARIVRAGHGGGQTATLEDHRDRALDQLAEFLPLRRVPRENGAIALYSRGGATLLDGKAATLGFSPVNVVTPHMTVQNGQLSGLTINDEPIRVSGDDHPIAGGRLGALFELRDEQAVSAQAGVDAIARDLIQRFQTPGLDPTRAPGDAGLFTDSDQSFSPADETGLAGRIAVNPAVVPEKGGAAWRLRDGINAAVPGPAGDAGLLRNLEAALGASQSLTSGGLGVVARSAADHMAALASDIGQTRLRMDRDMSHAAAQREELYDLRARKGVDSDAEMQKLLLIEQAYGANVRMIQTLDEMMQTLLRI